VVFIFLQSLQAGFVVFSDCTLSEEHFVCLACAVRGANIATPNPITNSALDEALPGMDAPLGQRGEPLDGTHRAHSRLLMAEAPLS